MIRVWLMFLGNGKGVHAQIRVHSSNFWNRIAASWDVGFGEAYMEGEVESSNLVAFFELLIENRDGSFLMSSSCHKDTYALFTWLIFD